MTALGALALVSSLAFAQTPAKTGRWERKPRALLFFDAEGSLANEIHLGDGDDGSSTMSRASSGGASADHRLCWVFEKTTFWGAGRGKILSTQRRLRFFGSDGKVLWESAEADAPLEGGEPLIFSRDGEVALLAERGAKGWRVTARSYLGTSIMDAGPFPELHEAVLTADGRFALARWTVPDQSATHTFLDLKKKTRKDVPTSKFTLGHATLEEGGKVFSDKKLAFDLSAEGESKP